MASADYDKGRDQPMTKTQACGIWDTYFFVPSSGKKMFEGICKGSFLRNPNYISLAIVHITTAL
jgi:hypothetical protein